MDSALVLYMLQLIIYKRLTMHVCLIRSGNVFISDASDGNDLQKAPKCAAANFVECVYIQGASVNQAILQHCFFFLVRQHWDECRYSHFAANFKAF